MLDGDGDRPPVPAVAVPGLPPIQPDEAVDNVGEAAVLSLGETLNGHELSVMRWPGAVSMVCHRCGADSVGATYQKARDALEPGCSG